MADGVPGGYGVVARRGGGGRVVEPVVAPTYGTSGGYYTDAQGRQITQAQAQALGRVDQPGAAAEKLRAIGGGASTTQIEQRMGIEEARKRGEITRQEAITLTQQNIEGRPLQIFRQVEQEKQRRADVAALQEFRERTGRISPVGRGYREAITQKETIKYAPERVYVKIGDRNVPFVQKKDEYKGLTAAETIQKAGGLRTTAAILSSTELFAKAAETEARGIGKLLGFDSGYDKALGELVVATSERLKAKPGALNVLLESPATAAIPIGAGLKAGTFLSRIALIKTAGSITSATPKAALAAKILRTGSLAIEPAAGIGMAGYVASDLLSSKDFYEAVGKGSAFAAMTPGAVFGYGKAGAAISAIRTTGFKTVPSPVPKDVLSGKHTFPTTKAGSFAKFREEFRDIEGKYSGYHATSEALSESGVIVRGMRPRDLRPLDVPGMYVSPVKAGASPVFLRIPGESPKHISTLAGLKAFLRSESSTLYMGKSKEGMQPGAERALSSSALNPEVNFIRDIDNIKRIHGGKNVQKSRDFLFSSRPRRGTAYIEPKIEMGGFKGESQGVLAPGTRISGITKASRFIYKGQYIPLVERSVLSSEGKTSAKTLSFETTQSSNILRTRQYYESGGVRPMPQIGYSTTRPPSRPSNSLSSLPRSILKQYSRPEESIRRITSSITIASSILRPPTSRTPPASTTRKPPSRPPSKPPSRPPTSTTRKPPPRPPTSTTRRPPSRPPTSTTRKPPPRPPSKPPTRKKPPIPPKSFEDQLGEFEKARKKRGKFVWNIKNQIPTLESLIG